MQYERLRQEAVRGNVRSGPGLSVLIARGLLALMELVEQVSNNKFQNDNFHPEKIKPPFLQETEKQIVQLLAGMVLSQHQEVMHVY